MTASKETARAGAVWAAARVRLEDELGWLRTHTWLGGLRLRSIERGQAVLEAESAKVRTGAKDHFELIKAALSEATGRSMKVRFVLGRRPQRKQPVAAEEVPLDLRGERVSGHHLLSGFLTGAEGALPVRFAQDAIENPGRWHPLVYYGESGSGKTHLLQGVVNGVRRRRPASRVVYTTGHRFARHYAATMRRRHTRDFRRLYREVDLLVIDDIQELAGKQATERELCFTLDHLHLAGRQVVLSCTNAPQKVGGLDDALRGRLLGGQVVPLRQPGPGTRRAIAQARCASTRLDLDVQVFELLCEGVDLNARELLTALTRLEAHQRAGNKLNLSDARDALQDLLEQKLRPASLEGVAVFVADRMGTSVDQLRGRSRKPTLVRARQVAMALSRELTDLTLREVGGYFGGRSCASVHFAQSRVAEMREEDEEVRILWGDAGRRFTRSERSS